MNPTIEQTQKLGGLIAEQRDLKNRLHTVENAITELTLELLGDPITRDKKAVPESIFSTFKYQTRTSDRMGAYEVSEQQDNDAQKIAEALNILEANKATIKDRFHPEGYVFCYWVYQNRIYRQKLS